MTGRKKLIGVALPSEAIDRKAAQGNQFGTDICRRCLCNTRGDYNREVLGRPIS
jgi:hypothetical protein